MQALADRVGHRVSGGGAPGRHVAALNGACAFVGTVSRAEDDLITLEPGCTFHYRIGDAWTTLVCRGEETMRVTPEHTIMHGKDFLERNTFMSRAEQRNRIMEHKQKEADLERKKPSTL